MIEKIRNLMMTAAILFIPMGMSYADTLSMPVGRTIDLGDEVELWNTKDSRIGKEVAAKMEAVRKSVAWQKAVDNMAPAGADKKKFHALVNELWEQSTIYQVRAKKEDIFHQGFLVSLALPKKEIKEYKEKWDKEGTGKLIPSHRPLGRFLKAKEWVSEDAEAVKENVFIYIEKDKKETVKNKQTGMRYHTRIIRTTIDVDGYILPLFLETVEMEDDKKIGYLFLLADQPSGDYFQKQLKDSLKGKKHEQTT